MIEQANKQNRNRVKQQWTQAWLRLNKINVSYIIQPDYACKKLNRLKMGIIATRSFNLKFGESENAWADRATTN